MNRKTIVALLVFIVLLGLVLFLHKQPEKGERVGERVRPLAKLDRTKIQKISLASKGTTVVLARTDKDTFKLIKPVDYPADKTAVDSLLDRLEKLEFGDMITENKAKHAEYNVDDKSGIHVQVSDGKEALADFYLGKVLEEYTLFRLAGKDPVLQAVGSLRPSFDREPEGWRNRGILEFKQEEARKLEVITDSGSIALSRADEKAVWKVDSSRQVKIDQLDGNTVSSLLSSLASLSAFDFADGITLEKSGLNKPKATLAVTLKAGPPLTLLLGNSQGEDHWVQRKGAPQVFVVKKYVAENLLKRPVDFRDKTVLSFKADDVVELVLEKKKDKESVTLVRKDADWMKDGKKLSDASKIKAAIEALASLKADGFSRTSAKDLGLDKPDWVVGIQLKDRTRYTLTVGSVEKDSFYGLMRKGVPDIFTFRKFNLDRFLLDIKTIK